ncbi:hypothetical protein [Thermogemmatispora sp.]|uniref:hypothetical protein n=1 Tax=Thermogemmatispora sp. TaxID=1968838 RepID=UPI001DE91276|nr:hypothetical protein [Thermogemmatispora sp.]MBX5451360.1 hypothetical protein [Thermogemmatispora sp.]
MMNLLLRAVSAIYTVDELFQWLCYAFIEHFQIELIEFWTPLLTPARTSVLHLRTMLPRDPNLPEQITYNEQMLLIAQRLAFEQRPVQTFAIEMLFPPQQVGLLHQYACHYCLGGFMSSPVLLPAPPATPGPQEPLPFALTYLFFTSYPPQADLQHAITTLLRQAIGLATQRGLLLPLPTAASAAPGPNMTVPGTVLASMRTPGPGHQSQPVPLTALIPRRKEDAELLTSDNPFARSAAISDKRARRLHAAIDGVQSIAELVHSTGMELADVLAALHILVKMRRVELVDPDGHPVNAERLFES